MNSHLKLLLYGYIIGVGISIGAGINIGVNSWYYLCCYYHLADSFISLLLHPILHTAQALPWILHQWWASMLLLLEQWWRSRTTVSGHATTCASLNCRPYGREGKITGQRSSKICAFLLSLETDFFIKCRHILPSVCLFNCVFTFTAAVAFCNVSVRHLIVTYTSRY